MVELLTCSSRLASKCPSAFTILDDQAQLRMRTRELEGGQGEETAWCVFARTQPVQVRSREGNVADEAMVLRWPSGLAINAALD